MLIRLGDSTSGTACSDIHLNPKRGGGNVRVIDPQNLTWVGLVWPTSLVLSSTLAGNSLDHTGNVRPLVWTFEGLLLWEVKKKKKLETFGPFFGENPKTFVLRLDTT